MKELIAMISLKKIFAVIIPAFMITGGLAQEESNLSLDRLVAELLNNNPRLQASRHKTAAARTVVKQVTAWEAPQIGVEFFQTPIQSFPNPLKDNMETDYFVQQMFPFPGKLSAMSQAARFAAEMRDQDYSALERKMIEQLKSAYYELYLVQQKIRINAENKELVKKFIEIALKQYEGGMGIQADVLRAQTEFSSLLSEEINLHQEQSSVTAMINTFINHPVNNPLGTIKVIQPDSLRWSFEKLQILALQNRPELKGMNFNIAMTNAELSAAQREYYPDLMARAMYKDMTDTKNDFWSVMVGINIPLAFWSGGKYTAKVEENRLKAMESENELADMKNMVSYELQNTVINLQTGYQSIKLYRDIRIPQAEQTLQSTVSAYQTGKTEFLMVIDSYRMLLMANLDYQMSLMKYLVDQAQLEQVIGINIADIASKIQYDFKEK